MLNVLQVKRIWHHWMFFCAVRLSENLTFLSLQNCLSLTEGDTKFHVHYYFLLLDIFMTKTLENIFHWWIFYKSLANTTFF